MSKGFKFIDLFSGIGGFHLAMSQLGGECVFSAEIDKNCVEVYEKNFKINSANDVTKINASDIPAHDVLCAGFPCQAFSKAGKQGGINDTRGTLFYDIARILKHHKTKYIILENVRNLVSHDKGNTWKTIKNTLISLGYRLPQQPIVLSPHHFGVPQFRERVYILGIYDPENINLPLNIDLPNLLNKEDNTIDSILSLSDKIDHKYNITDTENKILNIWNEFYKNVIKKTIGFPVWVDYFKLNSMDPSLPKWKQNIIQKNIDLYKKNQYFIDEWLKKYNNLSEFSSTQRKFEWQAGDTINDIWQGVIQFRPSGIRVKKPDVFSTLVALVQTQIIGKFKRRLTPREAARLQSFPENYIFSSKDSVTYKQLGNSVNVRILFELGIRLFENVFVNDIYISSKEQLVNFALSLLEKVKIKNNYSDATIADLLGMSRQAFKTIKDRGTFGLDLIFKILTLVDGTIKLQLSSNL